MGNPEVRTETPAPRFRITYASEDPGVFDDAPVMRWVDEFAKRLRLEFESVAITKINLGAPGGENAQAAGSVTEASGLLARAKADDYVVVFTPDLAQRPLEELELLVDDLWRDQANLDLRPVMWLVKLDKSTFRNLGIGKAPVWHELKGRAADGARFHRTKEVGWDDEMADAAKDIAGHRSCRLVMYCCPRHAAGSPAGQAIAAPQEPASAPAPTPGGGLFSRLGGLFRRGAG
jgi:hypothetical protein